MYDVTFETKCWEKDWKYVLDADRLKSVIDNNKYKFSEKIVYINNVDDLELVKKQAERLVKEKIITSYVVVENYADKALKFFGIDKDSFNGGYYYSIQELVGIYLCKSKYLLHYSSDAYLKTPINWIDQAINKLNNDKRVKVTNLTWGGRHYQFKLESIDQDSDFYYSYGFSDQNYLIEVSNYRSKIYNEKRKASDRYPPYGGELFEKRVDSWLRNHSYLRATYRHGEYTHKNFEKRNVVQFTAQIPRKIKQGLRLISPKARRR